LAFDDLGEQLRRRTVDPVQVLDCHYNGRKTAAGFQQLLQKLARTQADQYAIEPLQRIIWYFEAKQVQ
jgi:hypothetical protein